MSVELTVVIAVIGCLMTVISLMNVLKKDNKSDGIAQGQLSNDLSHLKRGVDTIILEQKDQSREIMRLKETLIVTQNEAQKSYEHAERAYMSATSAHKRIDKLVKKEMQDNED